MPHFDLPSLFRSSHADIGHHQPTSAKKSRRQASKERPTAPSRTASSSASSLADVDDKSVKMPNPAKRLSMPGLHSPKSSSKSIPQYHPANLDIKIESPPLVYYGPSNSSTGALLSGQLTLQVHDDSIVIEKFKMRLALEVTRKKPFHAHCQECAHQATDLTTWTFMEGPATLKKGEHSFPFSFLLPGHLPATMKSSLSSIDYMLRATVAPKGVDPMKLIHPLTVRRAVHPGDLPRNSVRIFPPTNLTANCELPPVIYPIGETNVLLRLDGVVKRHSNGKDQTQWKLQRLTWRLDETQKTISPACAKHSAKLGNVDDGKKGVAHTDTRTIGTHEHKSGWKEDYSGADGSVEFEFPFGIQANSHPVCNTKSEDGTEVSHTLIVEMIAMEQIASVRDPKRVTPTGAARVLRMHFNIIVTERAGMGISWDEEQPPLYENVPASPPSYATGHTEVYEGELPEYEDLAPLDGVPARA